MEDQEFEAVMAGMKEAIAHTKGEIELTTHKVSPARRARLATGMSQPAFAKAFGLSLDTVRSWERGKREPSAAARALFTLIEAKPADAVEVMAVAQ